LTVPIIGIVKAFRFRTKIPLEKLRVMHLNPHKYQEYLEKTGMEFTLCTKWDVLKMKALKFLGLLDMRKITILIPEEYL
jgi:hypothetical protein